MKRIVSFILALVLLLACCACNNTKKNPQNMKIAVLKGPSGMGIVKLMEDKKDSYGNSYEFTLVSNPEEIVSLVSSGGVDMAACPLNLGAALYQKTTKNIYMLAINTYGVLYVLAKDGEKITKITDLKNKTVVAAGKGSMPEYVFTFLLEAHGIKVGEDVTVDYKADPSEAAALAAAGKADIVLLPEPSVSAVLAKNSSMKIALDITEVWETTIIKYGRDKTLAQGCLIGRKEFVDQNKDSVNAFLDAYKTSVDYVNNEQKSAAALIAKHEIVANAAIAEKAIPNSNIVLVRGNDMKKIADSNIGFLFEINKKSIGGALPDEAFYYGITAAESGK